MKHVGIYSTSFLNLGLVLVLSWINNDIDILFSDIDMPGISGIELAESLVDKIGQIVFVTTHFKRDLNPKELEHWHYLFKPMGFLDFTKVCDKIIRQWVVLQEQSSSLRSRCFPPFETIG